MEKTKFYLIIAEGNSWLSFAHSNKRSISIALSKMEAEYIVYKLTLAENKKNSQYGWTSYKYEEVSIGEFVNKDTKEYRKFIDTKINELGEKIKSNNESSTSFIEKNKQLSLELECYKNEKRN